MGTLLREHLAELVRDKKISPKEMSRFFRELCG